VFRAYISNLGEYKGVNEFYKMYNSLKILDQSDEFKIPEPILIDKVVKKYNPEELFK
jgi:hypothetical protein